MKSTLILTQLISLLCLMMVTPTCSQSLIYVGEDEQADEGITSQDAPVDNSGRSHPKNLIGEITFLAAGLFRYFYSITF